MVMYVEWVEWVETERGAGYICDRERMDGLALSKQAKKCVCVTKREARGYCLDELGIGAVETVWALMTGS